MKRVYICDNNRAFLTQIQTQIAQILGSRWEITSCADAQSLRNAVAHAMPDIAVMDILIDGENGIALTQELFPAGCGTAVIFVTGYVEYCTEVYEAEHVYFLSKPVQEAQLKRALEKADTLTKSASFMIRVRSAHRKVALDKLISIESFYRKLRFLTTDETFECYGSFSSLPEEVLVQMIRCHKSFLVNPTHILAIDGHVFLMDNEQRVPISRTYLAQARARFLDACADKMEAQAW